MTTLAALIKHHLTEQDITQADLARLTRTAPSFINQLVHGTRQLKQPDHIITFAHALGVSPDILYAAMDKPPPDLVEALKTIEHVRTVRLALNIPTPEE